MNGRLNLIAKNYLLQKLIAQRNISREKVLF